MQSGQYSSPARRVSVCIWWIGTPLACQASQYACFLDGLFRTALWHALLSTYLNGEHGEIPQSSKWIILSFSMGLNGVVDSRLNTAFNLSAAVPRRGVADDMSIKILIMKRRLFCPVYRNIIVWRPRVCIGGTGVYHIQRVDKLWLPNMKEW